VNEFVAARLRESADLLAAQQDSPFRVLAYRRAAESIASLDHSVEELLTEGGVEALDRIPHVGKGATSDDAWRPASLFGSRH
jgi:DNA polymerase/3'-5' exonuclease PolX